MSKDFIKTIKTLALAVVLLFGVAMVLPAGNALAQTQAIKGLEDVGGKNARPLTSVIKTVVNVLLFLIGVLSVIMIIFGGFKYVTSSGESSGLTSAKNTILYAVVGLVIAVLAFAIVNFVLGVFDKPAPESDLNANPTSGAVEVSPPASSGNGPIGGGNG